MNNGEPNLGHKKKKKFDRKKILQRARNAKWGLVGPVLLPLALSVLLAFLGAALADELSRQRRSVDFTEASGQVVESEVLTFKSKKKRGGYTTRYEARIRVRYFVGIEMETHLATVPKRAIPSRSVVQTVARLPIGAPVTIYYNENDHKEIVLTRGMRGTDLYALMLFSCGCVVILLICLGVGIKVRGVWRRRKQRKKRRKKDIRWVRAATLAGVAYSLPVLAIIFEEPYQSDFAFAWIAFAWIVIALMSAFVFAASVVVDMIIIATPPRRINSSADRAAPGSA